MAAKREYDHKLIENKWRQKWKEEKVYTPDLNKASNPFYNLMMFPYPSAEGLHVGNMYAFTGADVYGRFNRMQGKDVFEPIGLDGFGIHSENYSIKVGRHPKENAEITEENFYNQLQSIGNGYAWDYRLETYDPDYYKWTQWLFVQMFKHGLAYRGSAMVNWCPNCKTVLADEQVEAGVCERCKTEVERREMASWYFRITDYAERLLENIDGAEDSSDETGEGVKTLQDWLKEGLPDTNDYDPKKYGLIWPDKIKTAQRNWIGRKKGTRVKFKIENSKSEVEAFTTRVDTIFGATFIVVAPEYAKTNLTHYISESNKEGLVRYINQALGKTEQERKEGEKEKTGVDTGIKAINPANNAEIPVFVADYVLMDYGTGAVMGVPAHDERDFEFAHKYNLSIKPVVVPTREHMDDRSEEYYKKRSKSHNDLLRVLVREANKEKIKLMIIGGWAVYSHVGIVFRDFEDLDLVIMEEDVDWWRKKLDEMGLEIKNLYPEFNEEYFFQAVKKDIHVDFLTIRVNEEGNIVWLTKKQPTIGDNFEKVFEEKKLFDNSVYVMSKDTLYKEKLKHKGEKRWKEKADFLFMHIEPYEGEGVLVDSGDYTNLNSAEAKDKIVENEEWAEKEVNYHLRDWLISRQRYWGPPIPMIFCETCEKEGKGEHSKMPGWYTVPEEQLPVELPEIEDFKPKGDGTTPLSNAPDEWKHTKCPECGSKAIRELEVSDTFLDSSWYFLAYPNLKTNEWKGSKNPFDSEITKKWLPVNAYIGGAEHAVLHLLYSRFVTMALKDWGYIDFEEPFPFLFSHGLIIAEGAKMSKSRGNVINPDEYVEKFGADALRSYLMFLGPYDQGGDFRDTGIEGMNRFLMRVWKLFEDLNGITLNKSDNENLRIKTHQTIKKVTEDLSQFKYNTAIAAIMELVNLIREKRESVEVKSTSGETIPEDADNFKESLEALTQLLAPFAPFMTEELWRDRLGHEESVHTSKWPEFDPEVAKEEVVTVVVQVNGKLRGQIEMPRDKAEDKEFVLNEAKNIENVTTHLEGNRIKDTIFVPGRLVNFVVG